MLTAKRLRKVLRYAPRTGIFRWKVSAGSRAPAGAIAGAKNGRGYDQIRIGGRPYSASRLAWLYMTGKWPNSETSYINGKPLTRDGQIFGKQHHHKIAVVLRGIAKAFAAEVVTRAIPNLVQGGGLFGRAPRQRCARKTRRRRACFACGRDINAPCGLPARSKMLSNPLWRPDPLTASFDR